jgi:hypothetical protein
MVRFLAGSADKSQKHQAISTTSYTYAPLKRQARRSGEKRQSHTAVIRSAAKNFGDTIMFVWPKSFPRSESPFAGER